MHTRVDSAMDVQVLNTIMMEAKIISAAHTQEATAILKLKFKVLLGHHASKVYIICIFVIPLSRSLILVSFRNAIDLSERNISSFNSDTCYYELVSGNEYNIADMFITASSYYFSTVSHEPHRSRLNTIRDSNGM